LVLGLLSIIIVFEELLILAEPSDFLLLFLDQFLIVSILLFEFSVHFFYLRIFIGEKEFGVVEQLFNLTFIIPHFLDLLFELRSLKSKVLFGIIITNLELL
jgi:hypothetical protein